MIVYVKYFVTWLFFMALIAGITLLVPKLARKFDAWLAEKRKRQRAEKEQESETSPETRQENTGDSQDTPQQ